MFSSAFKGRIWFLKRKGKRRWGSNLTLISASKFREEQHYLYQEFISDLLVLICPSFQLTLVFFFFQLSASTATYCSYRLKNEISHSFSLWQSHIYTSERNVWKYPFRAYLEAEYTAWPGAGVFPAALLICIWHVIKQNTYHVESNKKYTKDKVKETLSIQLSKIRTHYHQLAPYDNQLQATDG